jgi:hypothetical protein
VVADVVQAQRRRMVDQHAEHAAPLPQVADGAVRCLVGATREEARQPRRSSSRTPIAAYRAPVLRRGVEHPIDPM